MLGYVPKPRPSVLSFTRLLTLQLFLTRIYTKQGVFPVRQERVVVPSGQSRTRAGGTESATERHTSSGRTDYCSETVSPRNTCESRGQWTPSVLRPRPRPPVLPPLLIHFCSYFPLTKPLGFPSKERGT